MSEFKPRECDAKPDQLYSDIQDVLDIVGRITGKSGDLEGMLMDTSKSFSDLIASDIQGVASENSGAWQDALVSCMRSVGVLTSWAAAVETYNNTRDSLIEQWNDAKANSFGVDLEADDADKLIDNAKSELLDDLNSQAKSAWDKLTEVANEQEDMLKASADVHLKQLAEAGTIGYAAWNITGDVAYYPINDARADYYASKMKEYAEGKPLDDEYYEILAIINGISSRAELAKKHGDDIRQTDILFLEEFFGDLEENGVLDAVDMIDELGGITGQDLQDMYSAFGSGLLTLSDEEVGGNYSYLPDSVQEVAEGPWEGSEMTGYGEWQEQAKKVDLLLSNAPSHKEGGEAFSSHLSVNVSKLVGSYVKDEDLGLYESLFDVSTRNEKANYLILTGEKWGGGEYEHPTIGEYDHNEGIETLLSAPWEDDGESVRGLLDWIPEQSSSEEQQERVMAGEAAASLIDSITMRDGIYEKLTDTGIEVDGDKNASFVAYNPEVGKGLLGIYGAYIDDFSTGFSGEQKNGFDRELDRLSVNPASRMMFMEYIAGDSDSAEGMVALTEAKKEINLDYASDSTAGARPGRANGTLDMLVNGALANEAMDRTGDADKVAEEVAERKKEGIKRNINAVFAAIPASERLNSWQTSLVNSGLSISKDEISYHMTKDIEADMDNYASDNAGDFSGVNTATSRRQAELTITGNMVENGDLEMRDVDDLLVIESKDGDEYVAGDPTVISLEAERQAAAENKELGQGTMYEGNDLIDRGLRETRSGVGMETARGEVDAESYMDNYMNAYSEQKDAWEGYIANSPTEREDLPRKWGVSG